MPHKPLIKIGGVPEHFNLPWVEALEQNKFRHLPAEISWNYFHGGTGAMTQALSNGDLDIAILLTEGFIAAAIKGLKAGIIHRYISTPLNCDSSNSKPICRLCIFAIKCDPDPLRLMAILVFFVHSMGC